MAAKTESPCHNHSIGLGLTANSPVAVLVVIGR